MKLRIFTFLFILTIITTNLCYSQCVTPLVPVKYTETIVNNGNIFYTFTVPKADPAYGTLVEVRINTLVSVESTHQVENGTASPRTYIARLIFDVSLSSSVLSEPIIGSKPWTLGTHLLQPSNGVPNSGPDYYQSAAPQTNSDSIIKESITGNVAPFLGVGNVSFDFESSAFGGSTPSGGSVNTNATITFSVEYIFCTTWFLAADISYFSAIKTGGKNVQLNWASENEKSARQYEIQVSEDGINFYTVNKVDAVNSGSNNSSHRYNYTFSSTKEQLFFRVKQIELNGTTRFSATKLITWKKEASATLQVYPNPAVNYFTIDFPKGVKTNWRVDVISANGQLVQSNRILNADFGRIDLNRSVNKGFYMIRVTNEQTHEQVTQRLIVIAKDF
jgi:hypothetical protein